MSSSCVKFQPSRKPYFDKFWWVVVVVILVTGGKQSQLLVQDWSLDFGLEFDNTAYVPQLDFSLLLCCKSLWVSCCSFLWHGSFSQKPMSSLSIKSQTSSTPFLVDFGGGYSCHSCDRDITKSTPRIKT